MKLDRVSFYQAIEIPSKEKRINANTVSEETFPGVEISIDNHLIKVSHPDWHEDIYVGTSNVRYAVTKKEMVKTFQEDTVSIMDYTHPLDLPVGQELAVKLKKKQPKKR